MIAMVRMISVSTSVQECPSMAIKKPRNAEDAGVTPIVRLMTILEVAEALGVSDKTLRRWDSKRPTPYGPRARRVGLKREYRYVESEVASWLALNADEDTVEIRRTPQEEVA